MWNFIKNALMHVEVVIITFLLVIGILWLSFWLWLSGGKVSFLRVWKMTMDSLMVGWITLGQELRQEERLKEMVENGEDSS